MTKHLPQIITHLSDNDFYKYTMGQMFVHQFHDMKVEWTYKNRDKDRIFTREMIDEINYQIDLYSKLRYTQWELDNFAKIYFMKGDYVRFLKRYTIDRDEITCTFDEQTKQPDIHFRGYNVDVSYHEVPVMSIVSEVWFRMSYTEEQQKQIIEDAKQRFKEKIDKLIKGEIKIGELITDSLNDVANQDPAKLFIGENQTLNPKDMYRIVRFSQEKKERIITWMEFDYSLIKSESIKEGGYLEFGAKKIGDDLYQLTIPAEEALPGEYGIFVAQSENVSIPYACTFSIK